MLGLTVVNTFAFELNQSSTNKSIQSCFQTHFKKEKKLCEKSNICKVSQGIAHGNYKGIQCLAKNNYNFNVQSRKHKAANIPVIQAASYSNLKMLDIIFSSKHDINIEVMDKNQWTALVWVSASIGYLEKTSKEDYFQLRNMYKTTQFLLKKGANPNAARVKGETLLMFYSKRGIGNFVRLLISHGADVNKVTKHRATALMEAADEPQIIDDLIDAGANIYTKNKNGELLIFETAKKCEVYKTALILLRDKKLLNAVNQKGETLPELAKSNEKFSECPNIQIVLDNFVNDFNSIVKKKWGGG